MTATVCRCARSSLLVAVVGIAAVLGAPSVDSSQVSTKADSSGVQRRPDLSASVDWNSIRNLSICPTQDAFNRELQVQEVWCADGVEGMRFKARGETYVCKSLRYTIPFEGSEIDVLGGCIARLARLDRPDDKATMPLVEDQ